MSDNLWGGFLTHTVHHNCCCAHVLQEKAWMPLEVLDQTLDTIVKHWSVKCIIRCLTSCWQRIYTHSFQNFMRMDFVAF